VLLNNEADTILSHSPFDLYCMAVSPKSTIFYIFKALRFKLA